MKVWKYSLWTATLFVVSWAIALISALTAGKGLDKMREEPR
jgi:hypothetical protein